jgi:hypothetical protein
MTDAEQLAQVRQALHSIAMAGVSRSTWRKYIAPLYAVLGIEASLDAGFKAAQERKGKSDGND